MRLVLAVTSLAVACGVQSARAGGSVALSDLMQSGDTRQISSNFVATIQSALTSANVAASDVFAWEIGSAGNGGGWAGKELVLTNAILEGARLRLPRYLHSLTKTAIRSG